MEKEVKWKKMEVDLNLLFRFRSTSRSGTKLKMKFDSLLEVSHFTSKNFEVCYKVDGTERLTCTDGDYVIILLKRGFLPCWLV
jgi:hypothetical protein